MVVVVVVVGLVEPFSFGSHRGICTVSVCVVKPFLFGSHLGTCVIGVAPPWSRLPHRENRAGSVSAAIVMVGVGRTPEPAPGWPPTCRPSSAWRRSYDAQRRLSYHADLLRLVGRIGRIGATGQAQSSGLVTGYPRASHLTATFGREHHT